MAISEFEIKKCQKEVEAFLEKRRPPPHIRNDLDLGYLIDGQSIELYEVRPDWQNPTQKMETPIAKATYVKTQKHWKVFWQRADMKWHGYEPEPIVESLTDFLNIVDEDKYACFFG